jgi:site-specific recombinase XerD
VTTNTLKIQEVVVNEKGYTYKSFSVAGYVNGKRIRIRCQNEQQANMILIREQTKAINASRSVEYLPTHLTKMQLDEAEAAIERLGRRATLTEVLDFWLSHHATTGEQITLGGAIERYLAFKESRVRSNTNGQSKQTLNRFAEFIGTDSPVCEVTHQAVVRYLDSLRAADGVNAASNKYWNNTRQVLHTFFGWTTERAQGFTAHNCVADIHPKKKEHKEIKTLSAKQAAKLMAHVATEDSGKYARHFALALFAGIRPEGELSKLEERDIDLVNGVIKIRPDVSKVHRSRQITIQPNLREWLVRFADSPLAITEHAYRKVKATHAKGHDVLRHTFCSNHLQMSGTFAETAIESGNSEQILKDHYVNRTTKTEADKFWAIKPSFVPLF